MNFPSIKTMRIVGFPEFIEVSKHNFGILKTPNSDKNLGRFVGKQFSEGGRIVAEFAEETWKKFQTGNLNIKFSVLFEKIKF